MRVPTGPSTIQDLVKLLFGLRHEPNHKKTVFRVSDQVRQKTGLYDEMLEISVLRRREIVLYPGEMMTMTLSWYLMVDYEKTWLTIKNRGDHDHVCQLMQSQ